MDKIKQFCKAHPILFMGVYTLIYFSLFAYLEATVKPQFIIDCFIDDYIPFCEFFIIPYLMWFIFIPGTLFFLLYKDRDAFWRMAGMMFIGNMLCLLIYALFPNGVPPKHPVYEENIFCSLVNVLYHNDTPTNVCPSIHVLDTLAAHIAICKSSIADRIPSLKPLSAIFLVLVCLATVMLKQHSIIDVFCAFILVFALEKLIYSNVAQKKHIPIV
ncbi:MAG: phosphatase PAP2 family protein [Clostridia bacterium]|nr:phosphatase PAP2 family protein [Clostridia bacterium]